MVKIKPSLETIIISQKNQLTQQNSLMNVFLGILVDMDFLADVFPGTLMEMKDDATARRFSWSATWTCASTMRCRS